MNMTWLFPVLVAGMISLPATTAASSHPDPEQAREWVASGRIQPLDKLLAEQSFPGRILDVELEFEHGLLVYEIKWLDQHGRRHKGYLDAVTGAPLLRQFDNSRHSSDDDRSRHHKQENQE